MTWGWRGGHAILETQLPDDQMSDGSDCKIVWQVYLPVFVEGGKLSMGDMHFSQGDGEVSFCGAPCLLFIF